MLSREREQDAPATVKQQAVVESITEKHDAATSRRRFNALLATGSINDAIAYYQLFKQAQEQRQADDPDFHPLNVACVFSPPAEGNTDVKQLQEDLPQEKLDNQQEPDKKKAALQAIIADYNQQYGTNHSLYEFDLYYQDVQKRIKDQQYPNSDLPHKNKIDLVIVVDMLLTGFDSEIPQHPVCGQEPQTPRTDPGLLTNQPRAQRRPSPTATSSTSAPSKAPWTRPSPSSPARTRNGPRKSGWWTRRRGH